MSSVQTVPAEQIAGRLRELVALGRRVRVEAWPAQALQQLQLYYALFTVDNLCEQDQAIA